MNCKKIQGLILTDYFDKEVSEAVEKEINAHLRDCTACRAFEQKVLDRVSVPFKDLPQVKPPEAVWYRIKEAIEEEQAKGFAPGFLERLLERLRNNFIIRRPAFAFSTVAMVIIAAVLFLKSPFYRQALVKDYLNDKTQYMASLGYPVNGELEQYSNFETTIEDYLL